MASSLVRTRNYISEVRFLLSAHLLLTRPPPRPLSPHLGFDLCPLPFYPHASQFTLASHQFFSFRSLSTSAPTSPEPVPEPNPTPDTEFSLNPADIYRHLRGADSSSSSSENLSRAQWDSLALVLRSFAKSPWVADQALAAYIPSSFFTSAARRFRYFFLDRCPPHVFLHLFSLCPSPEADRFLLPVFIDYCLEEFPDELRHYKSLMDSADLTKPHTWFPFARAMKRRVVYHCGPTNSGKTYNALQCYMEAKKGVYCSPLRLLAMEVFDKVNALGVYCSLHTGQEKKFVPFSNHAACTVEMASTDELYDVAVIDEIQMMADPTRGYAWTRALLGLKADEIHLCGDPSVLKIVKKICKETGDELNVQHYARFKPLVVEAKSLLGDLKNVQSGDCIVAFSRREIFEVKLAIEKMTKHKCCVIYGALPPETRRQQASLFNDQDTEYDVLVASDAVGMGLNLNIRRVVFYTLSKYNGDKMVPVHASQVKQIAGRAGRRGSRYPDGLVTTFILDDLDYLIECLKQPFEEVTKIGLFPFFEQVELFAAQFGNLTFCKLLDKFRDNCRLDGSYFLCKHENVKKVANMLEKVQELSLEERYNFCFAPVNIRDPKAMFHLLRFAQHYSQNRPVGIAMGVPKYSARNDAELLDLETKHQILSMYLWLSHHFREETFPFVQKVEAMAVSIADLLGQSLAKACWKPESRSQVKQKKKAEKDDQEEPKPIAKDAYERTRSLIKVSTMKMQDQSSQHYCRQFANEDGTLWTVGNVLSAGLMTFYTTTKPIDKSWHVMGLGYNPSVSMDEIHNAAVVHFNGNMKPWLDVALNQYKHLWTKYVDTEMEFLPLCNFGL